MNAKPEAPTNKIVSLTSDVVVPLSDQAQAKASVLLIGQTLYPTFDIPYIGGGTRYSKPNQGDRYEPVQADVQLANYGTSDFSCEAQGNYRDGMAHDVRVFNAPQPFTIDKITIGKEYIYKRLGFEVTMHTPASVSVAVLFVFLGHVDGGDPQGIELIRKNCFRNESELSKAKTEALAKENPSSPVASFEISGVTLGMADSDAIAAVGRKFGVARLTKCNSKIGSSSYNCGLTSTNGAYELAVDFIERPPSEEGGKHLLRKPVVENIRLTLLKVDDQRATAHQFARDVHLKYLGGHTVFSEKNEFKEIWCSSWANQFQCNQGPYMEFSEQYNSFRPDSDRVLHAADPTYSDELQRYRKTHAPHAPI